MTGLTTVGPGAGWLLTEMSPKLCYEGVNLRCSWGSFLRARATFPQVPGLARGSGRWIMRAWVQLDWFRSEPLGWCGDDISKDIHKNIDKFYTPFGIRRWRGEGCHRAEAVNWSLPASAQPQRFELYSQRQLQTNVLQIPQRLRGWWVGEQERDAPMSKSETHATKHSRIKSDAKRAAR